MKINPPKLSNFRLLFAFMFLALSVAWGLTRMNSLAIWNSTIDNTVIGGAGSAAASFTNLSASGTVTLTAPNVTTLHVTSVGPGTLPSQGSWTGWNGLGLGETDNENAPGSGVGGHYWFNGITNTLLMSLPNTGILSVPNGIVANLTGTASLAAHMPYSGLTGSVPTWNQNSTGNSATSTLAAAATALAATPSPCGSGLYAGGINASGTGINCSPRWLMATGTGCTTAAPGASQCTAAVNWDAPGFSGAPSRFMCGGISPSGFPQGPYVTAVTGSAITVQVSNGQSGEAVASGFGTVTCWGQQ